MIDRVRMVLSVGAAVVVAVIFTLVVVARADRYDERMKQHPTEEDM